MLQSDWSRYGIFSFLAAIRDFHTWIYEKTGTTSYIPLLDIPKRILERYRNTEFAGTGGKVFKLQHHVSMNWQLKRIAKAADIDKRLTFHMRRHFKSPSLLKMNTLQEFIS